MWFISYHTVSKLTQNTYPKDRGQLSSLWVALKFKKENFVKFNNLRSQDS